MIDETTIARAVEFSDALNENVAGHLAEAQQAMREIREAATMAALFDDKEDATNGLLVLVDQRTKTFRDAERAAKSQVPRLAWPADAKAEMRIAEFEQSFRTGTPIKFSGAA